MTYLIIVPTMNELVMDNCFASIDEKYHSKLFLIDNSEKGFAKKYGVKYRHYPQNIGISRAWNIGVQRVLEQKLDYLIIMSATMVFEDGMNGLIEALSKNDYEYGMETQHVWHLKCLGRPTLEKVGMFDTNFYPAYYEDGDYIRRMELAGIHNPMGEPRLPRYEVKAHTQGNAQALKLGLKVNLGACNRYFVEKWGGHPEYDSQAKRDILYKHPFNNPENAIDYFPNRSIEELKEMYNL